MAALVGRDLEEFEQFGLRPVELTHHLLQLTLADAPRLVRAGSDNASATARHGRCRSQAVECVRAATNTRFEAGARRGEAVRERLVEVEGKEGDRIHWQRRACLDQEGAEASPSAQAVLGVRVGRGGGRQGTLRRRRAVGCARQIGNRPRHAQQVGARLGQLSTRATRRNGGVGASVDRRLQRAASHHLADPHEAAPPASPDGIELCFEQSRSAERRERGGRRCQVWLVRLRSQPREVPFQRRAFQRVGTRVDGTAHDAAVGARLEDHVAQIALSVEEHGQAVGVVEQHVERRHESQGLKLALAERRDAPALQQGRPAHKLEHGHRLGPGLLGFDRRPSLSTLGLECLLLRGGEILWNASLLPQVSAQKVEPRVLQEVGHAPATRRALELGDEAGRNLVVDLGLRCEPCRWHAEARCA